MATFSTPSRSSFVNTDCGIWNFEMSNATHEALQYSLCSSLLQSNLSHMMLYGDLVSDLHGCLIPVLIAELSEHWSVPIMRHTRSPLLETSHNACSTCGMQHRFLDLLIIFETTVHRCANLRHHPCPSS